MELEPIASDSHLSGHPRIEMRLDVNLYCLVDEQNNKDNKNGASILHGRGEWRAKIAGAGWNWADSPLQG